MKRSNISYTSSKNKATKNLQTVIYRYVLIEIIIALNTKL